MCERCSLFNKRQKTLSNENSSKSLTGLNLTYTAGLYCSAQYQRRVFNVSAPQTTRALTLKTQISQSINVLSISDL